MVAEDLPKSFPHTVYTVLREIHTCYFTLSHTGRVTKMGVDVDGDSGIALQQIIHEGDW